MKVLATVAFESIGYNQMNSKKSSIMCKYYLFPWIDFVGEELHTSMNTDSSELDETVGDKKER